MPPFAFDRALPGRGVFISALLGNQDVG